ncbi:TIGR00366 family protein [Nannocystaceae bacterium ST9]
MGLLVRLGLRFRRGFGRVTPDPFVLAVVLTVTVLLAALAFGDWPGAPAAAGLPQRIGVALEAWAGSGLWKLMSFGMQMTLMLVVGTALAEAPIVQRGISGLVRLASGPRTMVGLTAAVAIGLALINWSLSLIGAALLAREAGRVSEREGWRLHYPLLCAAAYTGLMVWHGGLSGTAPLKATSEKDLIEVLGPELTAKVGVMPLSDTLFSPLNLFVTIGLFLIGPLLFAFMTPKRGRDPDPQPPPRLVDDAIVGFEPPPADRMEALERSPWIAWLLGFPMLAGLVLITIRRGAGQIDIDTVNLGLWVIAMLLHGRPDRFLAACERGIRGCTGIVLQFPLYAGIMALMAASGLSAMLSRAIASAGPELLGLITFLSAGLVNLFVPSGGGQWAVQGPIAMQAAVDTGVEPATLLMAIAYGDQWTNMIQPFWALPLLAVTGVRARDIVGYTCLWMLVGGVWIAAGMLLFG